ncbi:MAG: hypothetical protein FWC94_03020 [Bacteroidales bacterium]|nr:hypothetical protein [Bacteroidales bacterium]
MNNTFNISRFGKFLVMELLRFKGILGILLGVIFGVILMDLLISTATSGGSDGPVGGGTAVFLILITPFILYNFVYHPAKSLTYAMLPASWLEKFASAWVMCVIFVPFLLFGFVTLISFISNLLGAQIIYQALNWNFFTGTYLPAICFQAIAFCGAFWFRRKKVGKTILTIVVIMMVLLVLAVVLRYFGVGDAEGVINIDIEGMYLAYGLAVLLWTLALIKFPRTQI